jgi:NAD+ diphosphatase
MLDRLLKEAIPERDGKILKWSEPRALMSTLDAFTAAIFASARSLVDWNQRNKVGFSYQYFVGDRGISG